MQQRVTFVVRVTLDESGEATAVIELVRTGRKESVHDIETLGDIVIRMLPPGAAGRDGAIAPARPQ